MSESNDCVSMEEGRVRVAVLYAAPTPPLSWRTLAWSFLAVGFCVEYYQAYVNLRVRQLSIDVSSSCFSERAPEFSMWHHWTGQAIVRRIECDQLQRELAALPMPNPLYVLTSMCTRALTGDDPGLALSRMTMHMPWVLQALVLALIGALVVTAIAALVYRPAAPQRREESYTAEIC